MEHCEFSELQPQKLKLSSMKQVLVIADNKSFKLFMIQFVTDTLDVGRI